MSLEISNVRVIEDELEFKDVWLVERQLPGQFTTRVLGFYNSLERAVDAIRRRVQSEITAAVGRSYIEDEDGHLDLNDVKISISSSFTIVKNRVEVDSGAGFEKLEEGEYANGETSD